MDIVTKQVLLVILEKIKDLLSDIYIDSLSIKESYFIYDGENINIFYDDIMIAYIFYYQNNESFMVINKKNFINKKDIISLIKIRNTTIENEVVIKDYFGSCACIFFPITILYSVIYLPLNIIGYNYPYNKFKDYCHNFVC